MEILQNSYFDISKRKVEIICHILFWAYIFAAINIDWSTDWFDARLRPRSPAPLSLIVFALFFYTNAFFLIPKYFGFATWKQYAIYASILFFLPELIRVIFYQSLIKETSLENELYSRDSFIFGAPSPFFLALNASFIYRLTKDWFLNKRKIQSLQQVVDQRKGTIPYEDTILLTDQEAESLKKALLFQLKNNELYLNPSLTLRDLASTVGSSEKKVSYLINQHLNTNYYSLINKYRVEKFKTEIGEPTNKNLSVEGVALNCGFSSKSSFYRAFKAHTQMSPSAYIKHMREH